MPKSPRKRTGPTRGLCAGTATAALTLALAAAAGCGGTSGGGPVTTTPTATHTASVQNAEDGSADGATTGARSVLTIRPVTNTGTSDPGRIDCGAEQDQSGQADAGQGRNSAADAPTTACGPDGTEVFDLGPAIITDAGIAAAQPSRDPQTDGYVVMLEFTPEAEDALQVFARDNEGHALAFVVDGTVLTAPVIRGVPQGALALYGPFTREQAEDLADTLG